MVDLLTFLPSMFRRPETCSGDHCSSLIKRNASERNSAEIEWLPGFFDFRLRFFNSACLGSYTPLVFELREISRETVLTLTFMTRAMKVILIFFWSSTLIVYLCSEVNCLYICNTKLINLGERGWSSSPFFVSPLHVRPNVSLCSLEALRLHPHGKPPQCFS